MANNRPSSQDQQQQLWQGKILLFSQCGPEPWGRHSSSTAAITACYPNASMTHLSQSSFAGSQVLQNTPRAALRLGRQNLGRILLKNPSLAGLSARCGRSDCAPRYAHSNAPYRGELAALEVKVSATFRMCTLLTKVLQPRGANAEDTRGEGVLTSLFLHY